LGHGTASLKLIDDYLSEGWMEPKGIEEFHSGDSPTAQDGIHHHGAHIRIWLIRHRCPPNKA
jgi:hypothetical protein